MKPFTDLCSHCALFFDNSGSYLGKKTLNWKNKTFSWKDRSYNFLPEKASFFKLTGIFKTTKYYHYNLDNPMPLILDKKKEPVMDSSVYKSILDSDLVKKLNPKGNGLLELLSNPKVLIGIVVIGGAIWYFNNGGTIA